MFVHILFVLIFEFIHLFSIFIYYVAGDCIMMHAWMSEDSLEELVPSFCEVGSGDGTRVGDKHCSTEPSLPALLCAVP